MLTAEHIFDGGKLECSVSTDAGKTWHRCFIKKTVWHDQTLIYTEGYIVDRVWEGKPPWDVTFGEAVELYGFPGKGWRLRKLSGRVVEVNRQKGIIIIQVERWPWDDLNGFSGGPVVLAKSGHLIGTVSMAIRMPYEHHVIVASIVWAFLNDGEAR
jgi:hypothetical protein